MRYLSPLLIGLLLFACTSTNQDSPSPQKPLLDTLSHYQDGTPKKVILQQGDSVIERRTYRHTGTLRRVVRADSIQTYFDLHDPDSAATLKDYLQGRWRNLSADTSSDQASVFYIFDPESLTFKNPDRVPIDSLGVTYKDGRRLVTNEGMSVRTTIASFDTIEVTGYTLVRLPPDSL